MSCDFRGPERSLSPWSNVLWAVTVQISPSAAICTLPWWRNQNHPASCVRGQNISVCGSRLLTSSVRSCPTDIICVQPSGVVMYGWRVEQNEVLKCLYERGADTRRDSCLFFCLGSSKWSASVSLGRHRKLVETSDHVLRVVHPRVREASSVCD